MSHLNQSYSIASNCMFCLYEISFADLLVAWHSSSMEARAGRPRKPHNQRATRKVGKERVTIQVLNQFALLAGWLVSYRSLSCTSPPTSDITLFKGKIWAIIQGQMIISRCTIIQFIVRNDLVLWILVDKVSYDIGSNKASTTGNQDRFNLGKRSEFSLTNKEGRRFEKGNRFRSLEGRSRVWSTKVLQSAY